MGDTDLWCLANGNQQKEKHWCLPSLRGLSSVQVVAPRTKGVKGSRCPMDTLEQFNKWLMVINQQFRESVEETGLPWHHIKRLVARRQEK